MVSPSSLSSSLGEAKGGTQGSYLEAETEGETMQEHYLLSYSP